MPRTSKLTLYDILRAKGFGISYMGDRRVVGNIDSEVVIFDVDKKTTC